MTKCMCVGVIAPNNNSYFSKMIEELKDLALALELTIDYDLFQNLDQIHPLSYIGSGKLDELLDFIQSNEIDCVIFNDELTSRQYNYLSALLKDCDILDRTSLILSIFEKRAHTREAILQVEIAKLNYQLPRLIGSHKDLIGQLGGSSFRGSGETQLELDRRQLYHDLHRKKRELKAIVTNRQNQRRQRKQNQLPVVSLVGYTNSGKSTLMNAFLDANHLNKTVFEKDMLFATLETSTRLIHRHQQLPFLLTDTVGFISYLPHDLIEAFKSTLEEIRESDLLMMVIDASSKDYHSQIETTKAVLKQLEVEDIPILYLYNKKDLCKDQWITFEEPSLFISAKNKEDIDRVYQYIKKTLFKDVVRYHCFIPYEKGEVYAKIDSAFHVIHAIYTELGIEVVFEATKQDEPIFKSYLVFEGLN